MTDFKLKKISLGQGTRYYTNVMLLLIAAFLLTTRYLIKVSTSSSLIRAYYLTLDAFGIYTHYRFGYYVLLPCLVIGVIAAFALFKGEIQKELSKDSLTFLGLLLIAAVLFLKFSSSFYALIQVLLFFSLSSILRSPKRISLKSGIAVFFAINLLIIFFFYYPRDKFYPPEPDDSFIYTQFIARMSYGFDDKSPAIINLRKDVEEDIGVPLPNRYYTARPAINMYYFWSAFYGLLNRYFNLDIKFLFFISLIVGFCFLGASFSYLVICLENKESLSNNDSLGLAVILAALLSTGYASVNFAYIKPYYYSVCIFLLIVLGLVKNQTRWLLFLWPLYIFTHSISIFSLPFLFILLAVSVIGKKIGKQGIIEPKTVMNSMVIISVTYLLYLIAVNLELIPQIYWPYDVLFKSLTGKTTGVGPEHAKLIVESLSNNLIKFTSSLYKIIIMLTFDLHPFYLFIWGLSIKHVFIDKPESYGRFKSIYLGFVCLVLLTCLVSAAAARYMLATLQIFNFCLFYFYLVSFNCSINILATVIVLGTFLLPPKFDLAIVWGKGNNFKNPFPTMLLDKLDSESIIFHSAYRYEMTDFLSRTEYLDFRHVFLYQWFEKELDLTGHNFENSYLVAFDKWGLFQKMFKRGLDDKFLRILRIKLGRVERCDENTGQETIIKNAVFALRNRIYEIKLERSSWPFLLYRIKSNIF